MPAASNPAVIEIYYDSGYTGGVNYWFSSTEYDSEMESEWSNGSGSDEDSGQNWIPKMLKYKSVNSVPWHRRISDAVASVLTRHSVAIVPMHQIGTDQNILLTQSWPNGKSILGFCSYIQKECFPKRD
jgi:hypothetical protein